MNPQAASPAIRRMTQADLRRAREIADALPQAPHWPMGAYLNALNPEAIPRRVALVADDSQTGAPIGFAIASLLPPEAELETIAVAAEFQRRGVARRLFSGLATELRVAQVTKVMLEVRASNHPALALYRSLGFVETARRPRYYVDPQEDAVLLTLSLR
jgi:ribosomal-protein-alanine N-acetyltransferase